VIVDEAQLDDDLREVNANNLDISLHQKSCVGHNRKQIYLRIEKIFNSFK
jgi:hypothetical protein